MCWTMVGEGKMEDVRCEVRRGKMEDVRGEGEVERGTDDVT